MPTMADIEALSAGLDRIDAALAYLDANPDASAVVGALGQQEAAGPLGQRVGVDQFPERR